MSTNDTRVNESIDRGTVRTGDRNLTTEHVSGGVLVWGNSDRPGRELLGFSQVDDWSEIRVALARKGLGVGAIHQLETYHPSEVGL